MDFLVVCAYYVRIFEGALDTVIFCFRPAVFTGRDSKTTTLPLLRPPHRWFALPLISSSASLHTLNLAEA